MSDQSSRDGQSADWRIGIDVGGTNTDAVVLDQDDHLIAKAKCHTTDDVSSGIGHALDAVIAQLGDDKFRVGHVALGTTHATNAILERRDLRSVAVLRIGAPATRSVPPLSEWPADLRAAVATAIALVPGGVEMTGAPIVPLDEEAIRRFAGEIAGRAEGVSISSVFSPVSADDELRAAEIMRAELGDDTTVSLSHEIGSLGLLERENASALNAALVGVAHRVTSGLRTAMATHGLDAETYIAQNDGTLMSLEYVQRYPVLTIGSGPTNSMRGAAYLTGTRDALVIDVGGTSADIGVLANGFPRESSTPVEIGGVRTNFRMPDLVSVAIGGGTIVSGDVTAAILGPQSVGYRLPEKALVFGGSIPTLTDAAVVTGRASIGDRSRLDGHADLLRAAMAASDAQIDDAIERARVSRRQLPLIAVGGGSVLLRDDIAGVAEIHRPDHYDVANAIGAAIALVSGQVDRVFAIGRGGREAAIAEAVEGARDEAVRAGAKPDEVEVVEIDEVPLAYLTDPVVRIRVKAAGPLAPRRSSSANRTRPSSAPEIATVQLQGESS